MSFVKHLEYVTGIMLINTYLKGVLGCIGVFYLRFLFIDKIWRDVQNGSRSILTSISCQIFAVSPASIALVDLCSNLGCNNSKDILFLGIFFYDFDFSFIFKPKMNVSSVQCAVISLCFVRYHWIKVARKFMKKAGMSQIY